MLMSVKRSGKVNKKKLMEFRDSEGSLWTMYETDISQRVASFEGNMVTLIVPRGPIDPVEIMEVDPIIIRALKLVTLPAKCLVNLLSSGEQNGD